MSTYGLAQAASDTLSAVAAIIFAILFIPFVVSLTIASGLALWYHTFHPLLTGLIIASVVDVVLIVLAAVFLLFGK